MSVELNGFDLVLLGKYWKYPHGHECQLDRRHSGWLGWQSEGRGGQRPVVGRQSYSRSINEGHHDHYMCRFRAELRTIHGHVHHACRVRVQCSKRLRTERGLWGAFGGETRPSWKSTSLIGMVIANKWVCSSHLASDVDSP